MGIGRKHRQNCNLLKTAILFYSILSDKSICFGFVTYSRNYFYQHGRSRSLGIGVSSSSHLLLGDIVQIDFDWDWRKDHTMIVTKIDTEGERYVTYRSTPEYHKVDRPMSWFYDKGWKLLYWHITY